LNHITGSNIATAYFRTQLPPEFEFDTDRKEQMKEWHESIEAVQSSIVKIETPQGHGTGFLCAYNEDKTWTAIATAHHVVEDADKWQQPIRIHNIAAAKTILVHEADRVILVDALKDSAVILIPGGKAKPLDLPEKPVEFIDTTKLRLKVGVEVGWLGYPGIGADALCFFTGNISPWLKNRSAYLIDGVAISGVSGGPVFYGAAGGDSDTIQIIGTITAYMPNRTLPGLSFAQDVSHFQATVAVIKNRDEAERKKKEQAEAAAAVAATASENPPEPDSK
jgi:hypothetical protein